MKKLIQLYESRNLNFERDKDYYADSIPRIKYFFQRNLKKVNQVRLMIIGEAPLWGSSEEKYIYNPDSPVSSFLSYIHIENLTGIWTWNKRTMLDAMNQNGIVVFDISPYPLNDTDTQIQYEDLTEEEYRSLIPFRRIENFINKYHPERIVYRYARVSDIVSDRIGPYKVISGAFGNIDPKKLK